MKKLIPKKLKKGDTIGLITPSGIISRKQLTESIEKVEKLGYKAYYKPSVISQYRYLAGTDKERANELMQMFENKKIDAILCVRGGYGATRILNLLDYNLIKKNPKIFIGYSDITALTSAFYKKTGLVSFHGPVGISCFNEFTTEIFQEIVRKQNTIYKYPYQRETNTNNNSEFDFYALKKGKATGELIGGNLSVITSLIGTKFEPDFKNKIVFVEEIDERIYRIDRMLTQIINSTNFKDAAGFAFGIFKDCENNDTPSFLIKELLTELISKLNKPSVYGFPIGHTKNNMTIPVGIMAELDANNKTLKLIEASVM